MLSVLSLLAFLFISSVHPAPTTRNDLFHALAARVVKQPSPPVCCLRPLDTPEDDVPLSFEQWKAKQLQGHKSNRSIHNLGGEPRASSPVAKAESDVLAYTHEEVPETPPDIAPHILVPLTDRFNYASLDCSARVHTSHRAAKSSSSILSSKRDRYMLSPCSLAKTGPQFVVVELCDDIRIDTVQLANFEFFSGVFKDFSVSVAKTYTANPDAWTPAGTYRASNIRGVQSFHPPPTLRDFYRYIRIDFHSHYSSEYYCPVSLLRVYGLTHLEEWKWDTWASESRAKAEAAWERGIESTAITTLSTPVLDDLETASSTPVASTPVVETSTIPVMVNSSTPPKSESAENAMTSTTSPFPAASPTNGVIIPDAPPLPATETPSAALTIISTVSTAGGASPAVAPIPTNGNGGGGGESIYRTIMNRLTALETNHTLYTRYIEDQTAGIREGMRRLAEDVGRIEGIGKSQAQMYQRTINEWERHRVRLEQEHHELMSRVNYLADEIVLEKRLGIAQLCLLLAVLVFMGLTRGSRGEEPFLIPGSESKKKVREWGKRNLSFSGDWVNRIRNGSSRSRSMSDGLRTAKAQAQTIRLNPPKPRRESRGDESKVKFPTRDESETGLASTIPFSTSRRANIPSDQAQAQFQPRARSRTPSLKRPHPNHPTHYSRTHRPSTPTRPTRLIRANSHGAHEGTLPFLHSPGFSGIGPVPKSAKKWARSAHLHEVKTRRVERRNEEENGVEGTSLLEAFDFKDAAGSGGGTGGGGEIDVWVDTDASVDESDVGDVSVSSA